MTTLDYGSVIYGNAVFVEDTLSFPSEDTYVEGTLLARRATSADSYAGTPSGSGDRVTALTAVAGKYLKPGDYVITYGDVTGGAGPITMVDPDGISEEITATADGDQAFPILGVSVNIDASGTVYDDGDTVTFTVAVGSDLVAFDPDGSNGVHLPVAVLTYEVAATTAEDIAIRAMIGGQVRRERLIIDADGDGSNLTQAHVDALRSAGVTAVSVTDISKI